MKTIMGCERTPKLAFFAYREALAPLNVHFRADRFQWWAGESADLEAWVCYDTHERLPGARLLYQLEVDGTVVCGGATAVAVPACAPRCAGRVAADRFARLTRQAKAASISSGNSTAPDWTQVPPAR